MQIEYTRGRIVLSYYLLFPLMGIGLYVLALVGMALISGEPLLYELRVYRILPLIFALYFTLFPLSLLIGFWVGSGYKTKNREKLIMDGVLKGTIISALYSFLLLILNFVFTSNQSFLFVIIGTFGSALLGGLFSLVIAWLIVKRGDKNLKKYF